ncbi:alanine aminotransferase 2-like [Gastrophryne carolinensis]
MSLVVNPEDPLRTGVLVPVPAYPLYKDAIAALLSAVPVTYLLDEENNWAVNVAGVQESLHAARKYCHPKVMCIINPGNPTGHVMSRDSMEEIIKLAVQEKLLLLADEVYQDNVFAPGVAFHSFKKVLFEMGPEFSERLQLASINSISKGSTECGLRSGYVEFVNVDPAVFKFLYILKPFNVPSIIGMVAMETLVEPPRPEEPSYQTFFAERRHLLDKLWKKAQLAEEMLNAGPGIRCNPIQAALYAFPRIHIPEGAVTRAQGRGLAPDVFFCHLLLEESGIVLSDGSSFGQEEGTYHVSSRGAIPTGPGPRPSSKVRALRVRVQGPAAEVRALQGPAAEVRALRVQVQGPAAEVRALRVQVQGPAAEVRALRVRVQGPAAEVRALRVRVQGPAAEVRALRVRVQGPAAEVRALRVRVQGPAAEVRALQGPAAKCEPCGSGAQAQQQRCEPCRAQQQSASPAGPGLRPSSKVRALRVRGPGPAAEV